MHEQEETEATENEEYGAMDPLVQQVGFNKHPV